MMQWQGPSVRQGSAATYAADVFSDVLNQHGSRFQRRLVDSGLWQSVVVNYYTLEPHRADHDQRRDDAGQAAAGARRARRRDREVRRAGLLHRGTSSSRVKQQRIVGTALGLERASGSRTRLGFWWSVAGLDYFMGYVDNMAKQTPDDLRRYARTYIVGKPHVTGVLLSPEDAAAVGANGADLLRAGERRRRRRLTP